MFRRRLEQVGVGREGTDRQPPVIELPDAREPRQATDIDERVGRAETKLEERQQALAAGQQLGARIGRDDLEGLLDGGRTLVGERCRDHASPPFAPCIARHTVCGV